MIRPLTLAALLLAAAAPAALMTPASAQDGPRGEDSDHYDRDDDGDRDRDGDRRGERRMDRDERRGDRHERHRDGPRMHHRGGMHGAGMGPMGASFRIEMGEGRSLMIRCGAEPLADCVDAATPLLDMVEGAGSPMSPPPGGPRDGAPPPPPPGGPRGDAPTPPAVGQGDLPPLPESLTTPADAPSPATTN